MTDNWEEKEITISRVYREIYMLYFLPIFRKKWLKNYWHFVTGETKEYVIFHLGAIKRNIPDVVSQDKQQELQQSIPIIAMTANAFSEDVQRCLDAGMDAHIAKPIEVDQIKRTLALVLEKWESTEVTPQS